MTPIAKIVLRDRIRIVAIVAVLLLMAGGTVVILTPKPGRDEQIGGFVADIGPLNGGRTSLSQRATVTTSDGRSFIVDVADYPGCRVGSRVTLHRRATLLGVRTSIWPGGCR